MAAPAPAPGIGYETDAIELPPRRPEFRLLKMRHHWTGEELEAVYRIGDTYQPEAMKQINHFMRDWRCEKTTVMDPELIDRLYELQQSVETRRTMRLISAYRSEGYNASLLRAGHTVDPNSQHMFGRAVDVFVPGVRLATLRQAAQKLPAGGTGYYPFSGPRFVHIDTGPDREWSEMDPGERRKLNLPKRPRKKLTLDCSLTMAEVLREVSVGQVLAALPQGASVVPAAQVYKASYTRPWSDYAGSKNPLDQTDWRQAVNRQWDYFCRAGHADLMQLEPYARLSSGP